jgi:hypothetical protein
MTTDFDGKISSTSLVYELINYATKPSGIYRENDKHSTGEGAICNDFLILMQLGAWVMCLLCRVVLV